MVGVERREQLLQRQPRVLTGNLDRAAQLLLERRQAERRVWRLVLAHIQDHLLEHGDIDGAVHAHVQRSHQLRHLLACQVQLHLR